MRRSSAVLLAGWPVVLGVGYWAGSAQKSAPSLGPGPSAASSSGGPGWHEPAQAAPSAGSAASPPRDPRAAATASEAPAPASAPLAGSGEAPGADAGAALEALLGEGPREAALLLLLARAAASHERLDLARRLLEEAARLAPGDPEVLFALAAIDPAELARLEGIELDPQQTVTYAQLLVSAGREAEAAERLEAALLARLVVRDGYAGELDSLIRALASVAPEAVARHAQAFGWRHRALAIELLADCGRGDLAQRIARDALQTDRAEPAVVIAALSVAPGEALAHGEALLEAWPENEELVAGLVSAYLAQGRTDAVARLVDELRAPNALFEIAWALHEADSGQEALAARAIERGLELDPARVEEVHVLPPELAIPLLERRLAAAPRSESLRDALCEEIFRLVDEDPAAGAEALARHGDAWPARRALELLTLAEALEEADPSAAERWRRRTHELDPSLVD